VNIIRIGICKIKLPATGATVVYWEEPRVIEAWSFGESKIISGVG